MAEEQPRPQIGQGDVEIELLDASSNPQRFTLRPTYDAARTASMQSGGLRGAMDRVWALDVDAVGQIVVLGLGPDVVKTIPDLQSRIWRTGVGDEGHQQPGNGGGLATRCVRFIRILMNGGRPLPDESADPNQKPQS